MIDINFDNWKGRCSQLSIVCSESRSASQLTAKQTEKLASLESSLELTVKQIDELAVLRLKSERAKETILSDSYISYLMDEYALLTRGMVKVCNDFEGLQMINGTLVEADSLITLIRAENKPYSPNILEDGSQETIQNEFLRGRPDAYLGNSLMEAEEIPDVKSSFDYPTFLKKIHTPILKANRFQVAGYMDISGAKIGFIADCLSNTHPTVVDSLKWRLLKRLEGEAVTEESPEFLKQWDIILRSTNFDKLTPKEKVFKKPIEPFSAEELSFVYDQVKRGRDFLNKFHEDRSKLV